MYMEWHYARDLFIVREGNLYSSLCFYLFADRIDEGKQEFSWDLYIKNNDKQPLLIGKVSTKNWKSKLISILSNII